MTSSPVKWILSDNPNDWATQLGVVFAALTALFTGFYVWFTYHLMKATAETARVALEDERRQRSSRIVPLQIAARTLADELAELRTTPSPGHQDPMRHLTVLRQTMRDLSAHGAIAQTISVEAHSALNRLGQAVGVLTRSMTEDARGGRSGVIGIDSMIDAAEKATAELNAILATV